MRPLARLRAGAARVSGAEDLSTPLPDDEGPGRGRARSPRALNGDARAAAGLDDAGARAHATRRFAADAGHELRTPLTGLRANLDALARNPGPARRRSATRCCARCAAEQERIVHLLEGCRRSPAARRPSASRARTSSSATSSTPRVYAARRRHPGVDVRARRRRSATPTVHGWDGGLRLLVDNLLDNAALHGRAGGRVRVALARDEDALLLRVDDDGPGIAAAERERLLEPFARGTATTAPGTGLGLAIVAQQVALHGGELRLEDSALGGLGVQVRLPATAAIAASRR